MVTQTEQQALVPLPWQLASWARLAEGLAETRLPALRVVAKYPTGAALAMKALAPHITVRVDWMIGIKVGAGHDHGTVSGAAHPLAAATKLSLARAVIRV